MVTARNIATAAENRPAYSVLVYAQISMDAHTRTHEIEDAIKIFFPALDHLVVLFLRGFGVYGEQWSRAVTEVGFSLRWLIPCRPSLTAIYFTYVCESRGDRSKQQVTHTCAVPTLDVFKSSLIHRILKLEA